MCALSRSVGQIEIVDCALLRLKLPVSCFGVIFLYLWTKWQIFITFSFSVFYVGGDFKTVSFLDGTAFLKFRVAKRLSFSLFLFCPFLCGNSFISPEFSFQFVPSFSLSGDTFLGLHLQNTLGSGQASFCLWDNKSNGNTVMCSPLGTHTCGVL